MWVVITRLLFAPPQQLQTMSSSRYLPIICLALTHTLVDTCALLVAPLWPELEQTYQLGAVGLSVVFIVQSLPTSISQLVFGYFRDRRPLPVLLLLGPVGAVLLTLLGVAPNLAMLCAVMVLGGICVGAFHPEAAVAAGRMLPEERTRGVSIFMLGGSLGLGLGPLLGGILGTDGLIYVAPFVLLAILALRRVGRLDVTAAAPVQSGPKPTLHEMLEGRLFLAVFLLLICALRLVPNMAFDKVLSFVLHDRGYSRPQIGLSQTLLLGSAGVGAWLMVWRFRAGWERAFLIGCPLMGIPLMLAMGYSDCPTWLLLALLVPSGIILWGTMPAMVSYSQQLFPSGAGVASAITMGLAWGVGGLIQAPITAWFQKAGMPQQAFYAYIPCLALAGLGAWFLPVVGTASHTVKAAADSPTPVAE